MKIDEKNIQDKDLPELSETFDDVLHKFSYNIAYIDGDVKPFYLGRGIDGYIPTTARAVDPLGAYPPPYPPISISNYMICTIIYHYTVDNSVKYMITMES